MTRIVNIKDFIEVLTSLPDDAVARIEEVEHSHNALTLIRLEDADWFAPPDHHEARVVIEWDK